MYDQVTKSEQPDPNTGGWDSWMGQGHHFRSSGADFCVWNGLLLCSRLPFRKLKNFRWSYFPRPQLRPLHPCCALHAHYPDWERPCWCKYPNDEQRKGDELCSSSDVYFRVLNRQLKYALQQTNRYGPRYFLESLTTPERWTAPALTPGEQDNSPFVPSFRNELVEVA